MVDFVQHGSPSSRRAWIEIAYRQSIQSVQNVALLAEGVDRNIINRMAYNAKTVALLAEGVDRNHLCGGLRRLRCQVALLAEGVDRNPHRKVYLRDSGVALLAEGVDRNHI